MSKSPFGINGLLGGDTPRLHLIFTFSGLFLNFVWFFAFDRSSLSSIAVTYFPPDKSLTPSYLLFHGKVRIQTEISSLIGFLTILISTWRRCFFLPRKNQCINNAKGYIHGCEERMGKAERSGEKSMDGFWIDMIQISLIEWQGMRYLFNKRQVFVQR